MLVFPDISPSESYSPSLGSFTFLADEYPNGVNLARAGRLFQTYALSFRYTNRSLSDIAPILDFHAQMRGRLTRFVFVDFAGKDATPIGWPWPRLYVATADNVLTDFDVPMKNSSSYTLFRAGNPLIATTDYTVNPGAGANGRDKVTLLAANCSRNSGGSLIAGAIGDLLEWKATGRGMFPVRFDNDRPQLEVASGDLCTLTLGVKAAR